MNCLETASLFKRLFFMNRHKTEMIHQINQINLTNQVNSSHKLAAGGVAPLHFFN